MHTLSRLLTAMTLAIISGLPAHAATATEQPAQATAAANQVDGEVKKINPEQGKITIKHGNIPHLNMPGMTMVFGVKDATLLDRIKPGDLVKFTVTQEGARLVITDIQAVSTDKTTAAPLP
ncbi:Cu/Ag efflux protein CusF [Chitinivorax tropicus]|uniref:Cu/Ag efflux protein CusF n=1 Tax=Chitinivorax tropicus TaxID=714531 RepID=A0A840MLV1_9PROT|nr:copper-binding protein [Chitinivorax tropicus]MBB5018465.1 Cu/Ag efflux protein CusF [Chitinivorax tropicus]